MRSRWTTGGRRALLAAALAAALGWAAEAAGQGAAGRRVALVVGNGAYTVASPLDNPPNDAADVTAALRRLDFDVVSRFDADEDAMDDALAEFEDRSAGADLALVFYAGHGLEMNGDNYLVPVDARLDTAAAVRRETIALDSVIDAAAGARTRIVILDACRNNPFARSMRGATRANVRPGGLAAVSTGEGLLVAYAAAAGRVALDGEGSRNSPYTAALLRHLAAPGVEVRVMFGNVGGAVAAATGDQQPFIYTSLTGEHYLGGRPSPPAAAGPAAAGGGTDRESLFWQTIANSTDPADFEAYKRRYPRGDFVDLADNRIAALRRAPDLRDGEVFRDDCAACPEMVVVPGGTFTMGAPASEWFGGEGPRRRVRVRRFAMGRFEVTRREYEAFATATGRGVGGGCRVLAVYSHDLGGGGRAMSFSMDADASWREPGFIQRGNHPAVCVSWDDARAYTAWLSRETGQEYRLSSEAEWEYAARANTITPFYWGGGDRCEHANGSDDSHGDWLVERFGPGWGASLGCDDGEGATAPVGSYAPNGFGLFDMFGNVSEWAADCYRDSYRGAPTDGSAWEGESDCPRVLRGGSWNDDPPEYLRSASRRGSSSLRYADRGFRVSRTLD